MSYRALRSQCAITDWRSEQDVKRALTKTVGARLRTRSVRAAELVAMEEETWTTFVDA